MSPQIPAGDPRGLGLGRSVADGGVKSQILRQFLAGLDRQGGPGRGPGRGMGGQPGTAATPAAPPATAPAMPDRQHHGFGWGGRRPGGQWAGHPQIAQLLARLQELAAARGTGGGGTPAANWIDNLPPGLKERYQQFMARQQGGPGGTP